MNINCFYYLNISKVLLHNAIFNMNLDKKLYQCFYKKIYYKLFLKNKILFLNIHVIQQVEML